MRNADYQDYEDSRSLELRNLVAEVRADLDGALHRQDLSHDAREMISAIADKVDALADLTRG
ncbi:hypothetical protein AA101099_2634 [Neoasaia chiangmaiensis NBRC 101099]|uniref:Uncharacterized protein n=1 Tax=Neoasaia chiangmaiensis TaxID=320497 RepID=A0A1U9KPR7_9PROT|nr:hypothetical protein [Neoasaia chiangmaiensis]AQS87700.1 hypothetical protein A0U93_06880 [Neoasaia chiangmaiensis]GBR41814.1 hypothetical protein AA101099_2634 [Neoasaia chiangmaiensis NBRC 101099]GEN14289.1 hypothetical protein NCH01_07200 [Neoasaia chiangmaiensis]